MNGVRYRRALFICADGTGSAADRAARTLLGGDLATRVLDADGGDQPTGDRQERRYADAEAEGVDRRLARRGLELGRRGRDRQRARLRLRDRGRRRAVADLL